MPSKPSAETSISKFNKLWNLPEHALAVPDDAMAPRLRRGDVAVYDTDFPQKGQIAVARSNRRILLREFRPTPAHSFALVPRDRRYQVLSSRETPVFILGRVVARWEKGSITEPFRL